MNWAVKAVICRYCLGWALDELSMSSPRIPAVKSQLRQLDSEACRELARQACECRSAQEIEALLTAFTPEEDVRPLLALENIFVDQDFSNKEQAIQFLCGNLGVNGRTEHPFELEEDVWQREEIVTTGVGFGVAIPHTKSQWIRHSSISIARLAKPIDWQSEMGEVELVIMLTLGANEGMNHVKVFSQLARKLVNKKLPPVVVCRARCTKYPDAAGNRINLLTLALKTGAVLSRRQTKLTPENATKIVAIRKTATLCHFMN